VGSHSLPDPVCEVNRCEGSSPRHPLPWGPDTYEGDHGAVYTSAFPGYQLKRCVRNNYPPIVAQSWDLVPGVAKTATPHRPIEAPPMQRPKNGRDDEIKTAAERLVR
jgi:hypothetical protein